MIDKQSCEKIAGNFKKGSFSAIAWAIGRVREAEEMIALKMLWELKEANPSGDFCKGPAGWKQASSSCNSHCQDRFWGTFFSFLFSFLLLVS